jgi:hypothetical protein
MRDSFLALLVFGVMTVHVEGWSPRCPRCVLWWQTAYGCAMKYCSHHEEDTARLCPHCERVANKKLNLTCINCLAMLLTQELQWLEMSLEGEDSRYTEAMQARARQLINTLTLEQAGTLLAFECISLGRCLIIEELLRKRFNAVALTLWPTYVARSCCHRRQLVEDAVSKVNTVSSPTVSTPDAGSKDKLKEKSWHEKKND